MKYFIVLITILLIPIQAAFISIPLYLAILIPAVVIYKKSWVFILATISGFFLDTLTFKLIGITSIILIMFLFLIMLYQKKFEIVNLPFVACITFISSFIYLLIFRYHYIFFASVVNSAVAVIFFTCLYFIAQKKMNK